MGTNIASEVELEGISDLDLVATPAEEALANGNGHAKPQPVPEVEPPMSARGLYMVRMPKPPADEGATDEKKKEQESLSKQMVVLRAVNAKASTKRDEVRALRKQMTEVRGLKALSEPEYQEKMSQMNQLKSARNDYTSQIQGVKGNVQGMECKSEAELDDKIRQLEHKIAHEGLILRDEKLAVQQIAKLNQQRSKVKQFDSQRGNLAELESEAQKVRLIIAGMDGEFSVIKSERDATKSVLLDISAKLTKATAELTSLEHDQKALMEVKDETVRKLDSIRDEANGDFQEYRQYRKFSLTVRDLVAGGRVEEARGLVDAQVDEWVPKLCQDVAYRQEYQALWNTQRKYQVSELLPGTCTTEMLALNMAGRGGAGGRGEGRGPPGVRAPPPEPRGAEKAKDIIEQLMAKASSNAAALRAAGPVGAVRHEDSGDADDEQVPVKAAPASTAAVQVSASQRAAVPFTGIVPKFKLADVELPKMIIETAFELPEKHDPAVTVAALSKEELREEQMRKAAEAEDRKRRRAETAERKKLQAGDAAKRLEFERRERDTAARAAAAALKAGPLPPAQQATDDSAADTGAPAAAAPAYERQQPKPTAFEKRQAVASARRPKSKPKVVQSLWDKYWIWIVSAISVLLVALILGMVLA